ncbi:E3 ubiquitin- protein ligase [Datura stramonium]|uniref:HECT-type E3 ubiquitin transferase n=1 Tax=Datura stramonium TaxID=4076 RepID=A0ABS8SAN4_DATST|nr:E3 ubiquitin- protein ligase [Datura stramonium]
MYPFDTVDNRSTTANGNNTSTTNKRKLDDFTGTDLTASSEFQAPSSVRKQRDQVSSSFNEKSLNQVHFFVRLCSEGKSLVLQAYPTDKVEVINQKIMLITGIPKSEQRLIYQGKQLQPDQTVSDCGIAKDSGLELVGRLRSTQNALVWKLLNELYLFILNFCEKTHYMISSDSAHIKSVLKKFLRMTPDNFDRASEHVGVFFSSSVPEALARLYRSPVIGDRNIAIECIREFIVQLKSEPRAPIYNIYTKVVLEFCKIMRKAVGIDDHLYMFCRSSLGIMLKPIVNASCKADLKNLLPLNDFFPFVSEIEAQLSSYLILSMDSTDLRLPFTRTYDFTAFMLPACNVIRLKVPFMEDYTGEAVYIGETSERLINIYNNLLAKLEVCLRNLYGWLRWREEEEEEDHMVALPWWSLYLTVLKESNKISKLNRNLENVFCKKIREWKDLLCFLIVTFATKSDDYGWIFEHKEVMTFEVRSYLAMMMFPEVVGDDEEVQMKLLIDRSQLLEQSFEYIGKLAQPEHLRGSLSVRFKYEQAFGFGVLREWFVLVCQAIFNTQNALFVACPNDLRRFFPNAGKKKEKNEFAERKAKL